MVLVAVAAVLALMALSTEREVVRIAIATGLVALPVAMMLVANNRFAVPIDEKRGFLALSAFVAALVCLVLGCIELRAAFDHEAHFHEHAEKLALYGLLLAPLVGPCLSRITASYAEKPGEVHVAPTVARALAEGKRVRELHKLRPQAEGHAATGPNTPEPDASAIERYIPIPIDRTVVGEPAGPSAAGWSTGLRSTVELPPYDPEEFAFLTTRPPRTTLHPGQEQWEAEMRSRVGTAMEGLQLDSY